MFTFIKKNLQIWMRLSTFANEKERNLIDMYGHENEMYNVGLNLKDGEGL